MTGKKDDGCCDDGGGVGDAVTPMRSFGGAGPAGYSTGPSHVDRADFRESDADAGATAEAEEPVVAEATAPKDEEPPA